MVSPKAAQKTQRSIWAYGSPSWLLESSPHSLMGRSLFVEYQVDAQPLRPCEVQRESAFLKRADYVPQCAEDGSFQ